VPDPNAGPGEIVLRLAACTVNPTDTMRRAGAAAWRVPPREPYALGMEASGIVESVGAGVQFEVGDHVMALVLPTQERGAYDERIAVPASQVARAPRNIDLIHAATLPMNGSTALLALDALDLPEDASLAVTGAAGAVGGYVVEIAKARGLRVIADSSPEDEPMVRGFGADHIVPRGPGFAAAVRELEPGGVRALVDCSVQGAELLPALADGGTMAVLRPPDFEAPDVQIHFVRVSTAPERPELLQELTRYVEAGQLTTRVARQFPLAQAADAHRLLEQGGLRGRILLHP